MDTINISRASFFIHFTFEYKEPFQVYAHRFFGIKQSDSEQLFMDLFEAYWKQLRHDGNLIHNVRRYIETRIGKELCIAFLRKRQGNPRVMTI